MPDRYFVSQQHHTEYTSWCTKCLLSGKTEDCVILLDSIFSHSMGFNNMLYGMILLQLYSCIISVIFQYLSQG